MARNISSDETKAFIDWLVDEHDICFRDIYGSVLDNTVIKELWDKFVDGE